MRRRTAQRDEFEVVDVVERVTRYDAVFDQPPSGEELPDPELVERAATLLTVMPRKLHRTTLEGLVFADDPDRARRAVDALIESAFAVEDEAGHLSRRS
jgi:hypothetical protein